MRISSALLQSRSLTGMQKQQTNYENAYSKLISNQKITNPSDDAYGAAHLVGLDNEMSKNEQYSGTRKELNTQLKQQETSLGSATDALQDVRTRVVQALNGTLSDNDRGALATNIRGDYETLVSVANTRDGSGNYIFSGYKSDKPPFDIDESSMTITSTADGSDYQGGDRLNYRIDSSRSVTGVATADNVFKTNDGENLFNVIKDIVSALETPTENGATSSVADVQSVLSSSLKKLDTGMENVSSVRAEGGTRMSEVEALDTQWGDNRVNLQDNINDLGTIDLTAAASELSYRQVGYEASIRAFSMLNQTSLLDLMS